MRNLLLLLGVVLVASCSESARHIRCSAAAPADIFAGDCPYLTKDNHGRTVLSWVRTINDSSAMFCYAVSEDGGRSFCRPVGIPSSKNIYAHSENLPKMIFKPSGEVIAVWGTRSNDPRNKYSGLVCYAQSFDEGKTWTAAKRLVNDTTGYDQRYADVALLSGGEVAITWLDNRKTNDREGSAVYYARTLGKSGFGNGVLISQQACPCCRLSMAADRKGYVHVLYRGIVNDSIRDMVHIVSMDGGKTFSAPGRIHRDNWVLRGCPHTGPAMTENSSGMQFAWYTGGNVKGSFFTSSSDNGNTYTHYDSISTEGSHPQIACLPDDKIVIAWDESCTVDGEFYKRIAVQFRAPDGQRVSKELITPDRSYASYPVVSGVATDVAVVAYCVRQAAKNYIHYQRVVLK